MTQDQMEKHQDQSGGKKSKQGAWAKAFTVVSIERNKTRKLSRFRVS